MNNCKLLLTVILLTVSVTIQAKTVKVLFIGNSYLNTNNIPGMVNLMCIANGDTLIYDEHTPGGYTLELHSTNATTLAKIKSQQWDIVVLQEQSQKPAFSPGQVATDVYPYAKTLDSLIRDNNSCSQTMFYMTWGRKNGDASNCASYPPICTYEGMQASLRTSYTQMAQDNNALVAPVGAAWKAMRDSLPSMDLYNGDGSHPNVHGSYLATCVFYASIFHKTPYGTTYISSLSGADAERIQYFAEKVTLDSLDKWQQHGDYAYADFSHSITNANTRAFQNSSLNATTYNWDFGDMNTSAMPSPSHTYAQNGIYNVTLTASNSCNSEQRKDTVNIGGVGINQTLLNANKVTVSQLGRGRVTLNIPDGYEHLTIYNMNGSKVARETLNGSNANLSFQLTTGIYLYTVDGIQKQSGKISVQ